MMSPGEPGRFQSLPLILLLRQKIRQRRQAKLQAQRKTEVSWVTSSQWQSRRKKGNLEFSLGNLFSCLCFTTEDQGDVKKEVMMMADKLDKIEKALHIKQTTIPSEGEGSTRVIRHP